jgi:bleomycin hydrolase
MIMKKSFLFLLLSFAWVGCVRNARSEKGVLTAALLESFRAEEALLPKDSAFLHRDLYDVLLDSAAAATLDTSCTFRVPTRGITDQMRSGRCWLFSTLNLFRSGVIFDQDLDDFEFSETYGQLYDILEKSNRWMEDVIKYRRQPLSSRRNNYLFKKPIGDGGHFVNAALVLSKYGIVPQEVMPERFSSTDNARMMRLVLTLLRKYGMELRRAPANRIQATKEAGLKEIYHLLTQTLGTPPQAFSWRGQTYTPLSFRERFIPGDLQLDYVMLMNDPTRPYYKMYEVEHSRNCYEGDNWTFLNLPVEELEDLGIASLKDSVMFYFSCDTYHGDESAAGKYSDDLRDFSGRLGVDISMTKKDMVASGEIYSVHAMAMAGVKLDAGGKPVRWVAENSYGAERGFGGFIVMDAPWFRTYLFRMVVEKRFLSDKLLEITRAKPKKIPAWNLNY